MTLAQSLPAVPEEPKASYIPLLHSNDASSFNQSMSLSQFSSLSVSTSESNSPQANSFESYRRSTFPCYMKTQSGTCNCADVLIADDDTFQHFYYQTLFQRSLGFDDNTFINIKLCFSGEELLGNLNKEINCGCGKLRLVVLDYFMGSDNLCGVDTALQVRSLGYKGPIVLRTSETKEYLKTRHANFDKLIQASIIDVVVPKG